MADFLLPDLGEGLTEAELLNWRVSVGDTVTLNQVIAEVETAKAAVELPSPHAGTVTSLHYEAGDVVPVGAPLLTITTSPATSPSTSAPASPVIMHESTPERVPVLVGYGATSGTTSRRRLRLSPVDGESAPPTVSSPPALVAARPLAKPQVRKLAKDLGVDLTSLRGTGTGGIVTRQDVLAHQPSDLSPVLPQQVGPNRAQIADERIPVRGVRRAMAEAMVRSAFTAPHVTEFITVDVSRTMSLMETLRASSFTAGVKLTPLTFAAKALLDAVAANPYLNSSWDEAAQEIVLHRKVNLGIAAATPRGLLVPNIKDAGALGLLELARALETLATTAREGRSTPADLTAGTISITNVGVFGVDTGTPIINPGEAAILCLGAIKQQPWVVDGELAVRWVTTLSLSFDHRLVDGEQGSRFLAAIAATLEKG